MDEGYEQLKIQGPTDDGEILYWSNEDGWVDFESTSVFSLCFDEIVNLPEGATALAILDTTGKISRYDDLS